MIRSRRCSVMSPGRGAGRVRCRRRRYSSAVRRARRCLGSSVGKGANLRESAASTLNSRSAYRDVLDRGGDRGRGGEGPLDPNGCEVQIFRCAPSIHLRGCGRQIDSHVGPAGVAVDALGLGFHVKSSLGGRFGKFLLGVPKSGAILNAAATRSRTPERSRTRSCNRMVGAGIERRQRRDMAMAEKRKFPWLCSVSSSFFITRAAAPTARQRTPSSPATTRLAFKPWCFSGSREEVGLRFAVIGVQHGRADGRIEFVLLGDCVIVAEEGQGLSVVSPLVYCGNGCVEIRMV